MSKIIGIDLGTSNSVVAVMEGGEPVVIPNAEGSRTTPSVVAFTKSGERLVGQTAKRQATINPENTFFSIKRLIGRSYDEIGAERESLPFKLVKGPRNDVRVVSPQTGKEYTPQEIQAMVLQKLKADAEVYLGEPVTQAVIAVPSYFNDSQRQATKDAGKIAGLEVLRIVNEPTAAALAYGLDKKKERTILMFDLGGGMFSVSAIFYEDGVVEVKATNGDLHLGGDDYDQRIIEWLAAEFKGETGIDLRSDRTALQRLKEAAEKAKIELSTVLQTEVNLPFITADSSGPRHLNMTLSRAKFEQLTQSLTSRLKGPFQQVLKDAGLSASHLNEIMLVGGSTRMPVVRDLVSKLTGKEPNKSVNPDEVVAVGAAVQAGVLGGDVKDILMLDVIPLSIGIETGDGVMTRMIGGNTTIPTRISKIFSTASDNQSSVEVHVLQGETEKAADNVSLGKFRLEGIPPAPRGVPQIEVTFDIDANSILNVSAKDKASGKEQRVTITGFLGLSEEELHRMIREAEAYAEEDKRRRELTELKHQSDSLANESEKSLNQIGDRMNLSRKQTIEGLIKDLRDAIARDDADRIRSLSQELGQQMLEDMLSADEQRTGTGQIPAAPAPQDTMSERGDNLSSKVTPLGNAVLFDTESTSSSSVADKAEQPAASTAGDAVDSDAPALWPKWPSALAASAGDAVDSNDPALWPKWPAAESESAAAPVSAELQGESAPTNALPEAASTVTDAAEPAPTNALPETAGAATDAAEPAQTNTQPEAAVGVADAAEPAEPPAKRPRQSRRATQPPDTVATAPEPIAPAAPSATDDGVGPMPRPHGATPQGLLLKQLLSESPEDTLRIIVTPAVVVVRYAEQQYTSPNLLDAAKLRAAATAPLEYGKALFNAILHHDPSYNALESSTLYGYDAATAKSKERLRIEISLVGLESSLETYKWEYLTDPRTSRPRAAMERAPFYRRLPGDQQPAPAPAAPLKVLIAICNPSTLREKLDAQGQPAHPQIARLAKLDAAQERDIIRQSLAYLEDAGLAEYTVLEPPATIERLRAELRHGYHVVHVVAHGLFADDYYLAMERDDGRDQLVSAQKFCAALRSDALRLVVLASCQSAAINDADPINPLRGLGARLVAHGVPAVIAMQDKVDVRVAQRFAQHFYREVARTGRVDAAMAAARRDLFEQRHELGQWQWGIPVLLMSTGDGHLFKVDRAGAKAPTPPAVKSYAELDGAGDPAPRLLAQAIEETAQAYDMDAALQQALSRFVTSLSEAEARAPVAVPAPAIARPSARPLAAPQERDTLDNVLKRPFQIDARDLRDHVSQHGERLDIPDAAYSRIASALNAGKHIILIGAPGTGKTSLAQAIGAYVQSRSFSTGTTLATATADWSSFDTVGGYVPTADQTLQFRPGIVLRSIGAGHWLVLDEINRAEIDKAFGELFTVLSGQQVDLPYHVDECPVRLLPAAHWATRAAERAYDYVIHPNWRILGTMNVYDKSSLFAMSLAFMRRFAFVDIDLPDKTQYGHLVSRWMAECALSADPDASNELGEMLAQLLQRDTSNDLMERRALGPAIVRDMVYYIGDRRRQEAQAAIPNLFAEAFLLYAVPQLDGLDLDGIHAIYSLIMRQFKQCGIVHEILGRVRSLYPHIPADQWPILASDRT